VNHLLYLFQPLPGVGEDGLEDNAVLEDEAAVLVVLLGVLAQQHEILAEVQHCSFLQVQLTNLISEVTGTIARLTVPKPKPQLEFQQPDLHRYFQLYSKNLVD
jgi:hypothetical protein